MCEYINFQLYDWSEDHEIINNDEDEDDDISGDYIIHSFGRCEDGKSVYCKIINFTPYFYILLPNNLQNKKEEYLYLVLNKLHNYLTSKYVKVYSKYKSKLIKIELAKNKSSEGFTNNKELYFARLIFNNYDGFKKYRYFLENSEIIINTIDELRIPHKFKLYEANLPPMLRCFHIRKISGCSWVQINTNQCKIIIDEDIKKSKCDIEIIVNWKNIHPIKKDYNAPLRIASFDIECNSIDGEFPQAKRSGDCVIQIGVTYTYIGQSEPYRQYIACLNETSKIDDNIIVESYETENELMSAFLNEINNNDCDILTGYNIFFFDEKYIYDRCKKILNMDIELSYMSKLKYYKCNFKEMKLSSSALGENELKFWETPGRVHIDLMQDVKKTFNLPSFKLDYVASNFIKGDINNYNELDNYKFEFSCNNVTDICINDFIHLEVLKGFVSDEVGEKYKVLSIDYNEKKLIVQGNETLLDELNLAKIGGKIFWSQAKDDIGPKDIFKLFKGSSDDRSLVAKYCIKDCKLVNLLINKLEVVTKNIEMANVCYVPLSFLFIRGQGIKLFSLCLKEFREQKYVFPVIKINKKYKCLNCNHIFSNSWDCNKCYSKKKEELINESNSFEGAIVFDPIPKVDYEACATKDYMSLYPASIIQKNMSHETIVENSNYDNLPGITYFNAQYKDSDGSIKYCRYAKINNNLGVIPTILDNLLKERKLIKKQMKDTKDNFKYKILDAKQLAVKITANSLYGQLGAGTSPIYKREIAACTTSTGREMLILAKKYDEEILPGLINGLKYYYKNNDYEKIELLYNNELLNHNIKDNIKKYINDINDLTFQPVIRYGDSVIGDTPLVLKNTLTNEIFITTINKLGNNYKLMERDNCDQIKESSELYHINIWTEKGWTHVSRVIRHKLNKKLYKVITYDSSVIVTEDHSLLNNNGEIINPKIGTKLLYSFPFINNNIEYFININNNKIKLNEEIAYFLGLYMLNCVNSNYISLNINNNIEYYIYIFDKYFNNINYYIINNVINLNVLLNNNDILLDISNKIIPNIILNSNFEIRKAFLYGITLDNKIICINNYSQISIQSIYTLLKSLMYSHILIFNNIIVFNNDISFINKNKVINIELYNKKEEYVYDLTTENHHFHAGIGSIIVHNTDSIFSCYKFKENTKIVSEENALVIWKNIIKFAYYLIEPYFGENERKVFHKIFFEYYDDDKIIDLELPEPPKCKDKPLHYKIILSLEDRIKQFIKEYMQESYLPWLWTLIELIEKKHHLQNEDTLNYNILDIKISQWAEHQLTKINLNCENLYENRKNYLLNEITDYINKLFNNKYSIPTEIQIKEFVNKFYNQNKIISEELLNVSLDNITYDNIYNILKDVNKTECFMEKYKELKHFDFIDEIKDKSKIYQLCKQLIEKTIKEKWINSNDKKELDKIIKQYIEDIKYYDIVLPEKSLNNYDNIRYQIIIFLEENKNLEINKLCELFVQYFNIDKKSIYEKTKDFIEKYYKNKGKKTIEEILQDFLEKELKLDFNKYKNDHFNNVIKFINSKLRYLDMSDIEKGEQYIYYIIQPRWEIISKKDLIFYYLNKISINVSDKIINKLYNDIILTDPQSIIDFVNNNIILKKNITEIRLNKITENFIKSIKFYIPTKVYKIDIYEGGLSITDKRTLEYSIEMGKISSELVKKYLPFPHDLEYEKTFWPFAIITKKKYVGNKYEFDVNKYKLDFMGIVLKRRDNSPIVKEICGGIINNLINFRSPEKAKEFTYNCLKNMFEGKYNIKYFLQSKTLKSKTSYKDWTRISHVYLADKISKREIGNIPQSGDRIEYAIIKIQPKMNKEKILQGDIIETPEFIKQNNLELDYLFYLTNQIMNPALQFLELVDKNAINIFNEFIKTYSIQKIKEPKIKIIKEPKIKIIKEPKIKNKIKKEPKPKIKKSKINIKITPQDVLLGKKKVIKIKLLLQDIFNNYLLN
jgi:DNA polymerase elongation subunit (family B)